MSDAAPGQDDLAALRALMEADRWRERVRARRTHLPEAQELIVVEGELRELAAALRDAEAARGPVRSAYDEVRVAAQRLRDRLADLDARLGARDAPARDLASLQAERDKVVGLLGESDDRELAALFALEPLDQAITDVRAQAQPLAARRAELQGVVRELTASLDEEVAALDAERAALVAAVPADLRERYERALARAGTSGAAEVVDGHCDGCRIALSPADRDRWRASTRATLIDCPECGRVLLV